MDWGGDMHQAKRVLLAIILLVIVLGVLAFVLENQQTLAIFFMGWATPRVPVSIFIVIALIVGLLLGPLLGFAFQRKARRRSVSSDR